MAEWISPWLGRWLLCAALAGALLPAVPAWAQSQAQLSEAELRDRLATLEDKLAREQQRLEAVREDEATAREEVERERRELADEVLELEVQRRQLQAEEQSLRQQLETERQSLEQQRSEAQALLDQGRATAEQMEIHLSQVPSDPDWRNELRALTRGLQSDDPLTQRLAHLGPLLEQLDQAHERATRVSVERREIRTATGAREEVDLLSIGYIGFAYRTLGEGRIGITLRSPADAEGYRWHENLPAAHQQRIESAIQQVRQEAGGRVGLPLDVTQRLRAEVALEDDGWLGTIRAGGLVMVPLGAVALLALILIIERLLVLSVQSTRLPKVRQVLAAARDGEYAEAHRLCRAHSGVVMRVMAACLERHDRGQHAMEDSIQEQLLHEAPRLNRFLAGISVLGAVAPLLGLLGTVTGIIQTFGVITIYGDTNPGMMAGGISEALITTATGLTIAIPIVLMHSLLNSRVDTLLSDAEKHAASLLNALVNASGGSEGKKHGDVADADPVAVESSTAAE